MPTETTCLPSGLQQACVTSSECAEPCEMSSHCSGRRKSHTCRSPVTVASSKYSPPQLGGETAMEVSLRSLVPSCGDHVTSIDSGWSDTSWSHHLTLPALS